MYVYIFKDRDGEAVVYAATKEDLEIAVNFALTQVI